VPLAGAEGAVLAAPLLVPSPVPAAAIALRRGYAVASADTQGAGPYSPLPLPGAPALVDAGEVLPPGKDAVLPEDAVRVIGGLAEVQDSAAPGQWARRVGEDAPAGAVLRQAGDVLRATDLAVAEAAGTSQCDIRRPRILFSGRRSPAGRLVSALARAAGAAEAGSLAEADLVFATGQVPEALQSRLGREALVLARRLALRPGEDGAVLRLGDVPVLLAPDRIADALAIWLGLGLPVLRTLAGASAPPTEARPVTRKISSSVGLSEIVMLRAAGRSFEPMGTGDLPLTAITLADAWAVVPPESEGLAAGEDVEAEPFRP
jgi:molybdopterin biosynthesis enzyme